MHRVRRSTVRFAARAAIPAILGAWALAGCGRSDKEPPPALILQVRKPGVTVNGSQAPSAVLATASPSAPSIPSMFASDAERVAAKSLYSRHCAACHGADGSGNGVAARFMFPRPRNFHRGLFRLVSTVNGVPTLADLEQTLARGMPGSAMPPWPALTDAERSLLARQVIEFRREGIRAQEIAAAKEGGFELDAAEMEQLAEDLTTPGAAIEVPPIPEATPELIRRGAALYQSAGCSKCHGDTGKGDGLERMIDSEGLPTAPRDLTRGIFKGRPDPHSIYIRTQAGMPGTPMPATLTLGHEDIASLVHFVLSLSDEQQREAAVLNSGRIVAVRQASLPQSPLDPAWETIAATRVRLTPLWWRNEFAPHVDVRAIHDGSAIAFRLTWDDATADWRASQTDEFEDAVALELYRGASPPFLGMGSAEDAVDVWYWDADRQQATGEVEAVYPLTVVDQYPFSEGLVASPEYGRPATRNENQPEISLPARASGNPIVPTESRHGGSTLAIAGPGSVSFLFPRNQSVIARGDWRDGQWSVLLTRPLAVEPGGGVALDVGEEASVAFAVWDGSRRDRNGQKSFTIWQVLELKP